MARPRASCSSTRPRATASSSRRSATTTSSTRTAAAACASSTWKGRRARCRPAPTRVRRAWSSPRTSRRAQFRKTLTEMLLVEHLNPNPGGRPNELIDLANEFGAEAPFVLPDAKREPYSDRNRLMGYDRGCVHPLQPLRALHAGGDAVLRAHLRGSRPARADRPHARPLVARHRVRALRWLPLGLPDRRHLREVPRGRRPGQSGRSTKTKSTCTFCGVGCQIDLNVDPETKRIVKMTSDPSTSPNEGNLCVKGRFAFNFVHHPDRLTEPLVRGEDGELHPTDWDTRSRPPPRACGEMKDARHAVDRRARVGEADERGELPHPEARPDGDRHELGPLLRSHLTRSDPLRPGQVVGQRS